MKQKITYFILFIFSFIGSIQAQRPVDRYGKLKLVGLQLSSECGTPVQLRGISTHGPQWFENCYSTNSLDALANDWHVDIFRIAMYVHGGEGGYSSDTTKWKAWIDNMVDECGKRGIYCLIDWHILTDGDPNANITQAKLFWNYMSKKHGSKKHVIYEICNEPNERDQYGSSAQEKTVNWARIKQYAEIIIPIIRKNDPETIIIVGTPYWSNRPWRVVGNPLTGANAYNAMYTYHYYAGTAQHNTNLDTVKTILSKIPIFATEWGLSEESGTGNVDQVSAQNFANVMGGANPAGVKVSWCVWSFSDKDETSALLLPSSCTNKTFNNRTTAGNKTYSLINTPAKDSSTCFPDPKIITQPQDIVVKTGAKATFTVGASGYKITYLWQKSADGTTWSDIPNSNSSTYSIAAITTSDKAFYRVKVSNYLGYLFSSKAALIIYANGPYTGVPINIPGKIEVENYDIGGQNVSFYDNSSGNTGGAYRTDDVDISTTTDSLGGYNVGYIVANEWMEYSVNVLATSNYDFYFRVGSALSNTQFKIVLDGTIIIPTVTVPNVNSWNTFTFVSSKGINLTKGAHKLRVFALTDGFNINYILVKGPAIDCNNDLNGAAKIDACGICAGGNTGITPKTANDKCYVVTDIESEIFENNDVDVFPNPFSDKLYVNSNEATKIEIIDLNGALLLEKKLSTGGEILIPETIKSGIYQIRITTDLTVQVKKFDKK